MGLKTEVLIFDPGSRGEGTVYGWIPGTVTVHIYFPCTVIEERVHSVGPEIEQFRAFGDDGGAPTLAQVATAIERRDGGGEVFELYVEGTYQEGSTSQVGITGRIREYLVTIKALRSGDFAMSVKDSTGGQVGWQLITRTKAKSLIAARCSGVAPSGVSDLPDGVMPELGWTLQTNERTSIHLNAKEIAEIVGWLWPHTRTDEDEQ